MSVRNLVVATLLLLALLPASAHAVELEVKLAPATSKSAVRAAVGGGALTPLVTGVDFEALEAKARRRTGRPLPDMAAWHRLTLPPGADADAAIRALLTSGRATEAAVAPEPAPPPQVPATDDFTSLQGYLRPAPAGIDSAFAQRDPRTRGKGVRIVDLEYYWTAEHEDLQLDPIATDLGKTTYVQYPNFADEHGTAVFGELVAKDNGFGVTGGVPDATMHGISPVNAAGSYVPAAALTYAGQFLSPGDVVLIEQQTPGPAGGTKYVPLEWNQASFDAIKALSALGIVVMETGGNGGEDLDSAPMLGRFDRSVRDSGAIIGGAGNSTSRAALSFSSHGTRVDLQGWGDSVTTTGSTGNLFGPSLTRRYTNAFNGTSSAGPIVVNAIVAVQSYLKATGQAPYTSAQLRELLRRTGTPQAGTRRIGPLPNVAAALKAIEVDAPTVTLTIADQTVSVAAEDGWGTAVRSLEYRVGEGAWTPYTSPVAVPQGGAVQARATDANGNVGAASLTVPGPPPPPRAEPPALTLVLGPTASFGTFTPGVDRVYTATTSLAATPGAQLTVSGPGFLAGEAGRLARPVQVAVGDAAVTFTQAIGAREVLRTGTYSATATFSLSTAAP
ncbi:S8 family serine peptidase [Solirubrobacter phytolaccae]|uniref:S8 family serine peptidase n=1 Tax=Solirubrobacter phytolaccae TaxID=1404360 RepID=A0A9X3N8Z7_9ACTN|nr:S8 family serine peptidase [Solirubrobacter phytolaccae]MDA0180624.1 S8 family serine peptidase [Solirubrobacter phytolaccae]